MEPSADTRTGRQTQDRSGGEAEERLGANSRAHKRILILDTVFARAKINLFLHVGPAGSDGYHPICSLMTFADVGDILSLGASGAQELVIDGPFASGLGVGDDNLVVRARDAALSHSGAAAFPLRLTKNLPLASGVGGGSADAAATLRLVASRIGLEVAALLKIAASLGSDVPACLASQPVLATGRGDVLRPPPTFPSLHTVLVNPGVASPTAEAYRAYDDAPAAEGANRPWPKAPLRSPQETASFLATCRNDLEAVVARLSQPVMETLTTLRRQPETLLARMSGSGATCFALVEDGRAAIRLEARIAREQPQWWVRRTALAGAP